MLASGAALETPAHLREGDLIVSPPACATCFVHARRAPAGRGRTRRHRDAVRRTGIVTGWQPDLQRAAAVLWCARKTAARTSAGSRAFTETSRDRRWAGSWPICCSPWPCSEHVRRSRTPARPARRVTDARPSRAVAVHGTPGRGLDVQARSGHAAHRVRGTVQATVGMPLIQYLRTGGATEAVSAQGPAFSVAAHRGMTDTTKLHPPLQAHRRHRPASRAGATGGEMSATPLLESSNAKPARSALERGLLHRLGADGNDCAGSCS